MTPAELRESCATALLPLDSATCVQSALRCYVSSMSRFRCFKRADPNLLSVDRDDSTELFPARVVADPQESCLVVSRRADLVVRIHSRSHASKIVPCVVVPLAVYVINAVFGPDSGLIKNGKAVRLEKFTVKANAPVPPDLVRASSGVSNTNPCGGTGEPPKGTRRRVIVQKLAQSLRSKIRISHDAAPSLIGQRFAQCFQHSRTSPFYVAGAA